MNNVFWEKKNKRFVAVLTGGAAYTYIPSGNEWTKITGYEEYENILTRDAAGMSVIPYGNSLYWINKNDEQILKYDCQNAVIDCAIDHSGRYIAAVCENDELLFFEVTPCMSEPKLISRFIADISGHILHVEDQKWFQRIQNGKKTVDVRLYDRKRRLIQPGDKLIFESPGGKCVAAQVIGIHIFRNFSNLYDSLGPQALGYSLSEFFNFEDMYRFYNYKEEKHCGVVGIEFQLVENGVPLQRKKLFPGIIDAR